MFLLFFIILLIITIMMFIFYRYVVDVYEALIVKKKKGIKLLLFVLSALAFYGLIFSIFSSKLFGVIAIILIYIVMSYFILSILNLFLKKYKVWKIIYLVIPVLFSVSFTIYGLFNMKNIVRTEYTVQNGKLNNNYKAILISDLHYGVSLSNEELKKYSEEISALEPDFVFLAGDIVDERTSKEQMRNAFNILGSIKNKYGIYYVYGNHDKNTYSNAALYNENDLEKVIVDSGITILKEDKKYINDDIVVIGRDYDNRKSIEEIISEEDKSLYSIVIDHVPLEYDIYKSYGINLDLSGHTHNGQVFPLGVAQKIYNKISNNKKDSSINNIHKLSDLVYGIYNDGDFTGIVTSGIAGWGIPIRTESKSEYVLINLVK